jgi:ankyrin repeat protein
LQLTERDELLAAAGPDGSTALHVAAAAGNSAIVFTLCDHWANCEAKDAQGRRPYEVGGACRTYGCQNIGEGWKVGSIVHA